MKLLTLHYVVIQLVQLGLPSFACLHWCLTLMLWLTYWLLTDWKQQTKWEKVSANGVALATGLWAAVPMHSLTWAAVHKLLYWTGAALGRDWLGIQPQETTGHTSMPLPWNMHIPRILAIWQMGMIASCQTCSLQRQGFFHIRQKVGWFLVVFMVCMALTYL